MKILTTGAMALGLSALASAGAAQHLVYGSFVPGGDFLNTTTLPEAFAMITEATGGEVTWELIVGGQLADGVATYSAVEERMMDAGLAAPSFSPSSLPHLAFLYSIVVGTDDVIALTGAAVETTFLNCAGCLEDGRKINAIPFGGYAGAPIQLFCTRPVSSLADMSGLRVRATGGMGDLVAGAGAMQMSMTLAESVSVLQRGGVDCVIGAADWLATYGYGDMAKNVLATPLGNNAPVMGMLLNRDAWGELSDTGREAVMRASAYISARHAISNFIHKNAEVLEDQVANNGVTLVEAAPDLAAYIAAFPAADRENRVAAGQVLGVEDPAALFDAYLANVAKWEALSAEIDGDIDRFAEVLWQEVFAKVDPSAL